MDNKKKLYAELEKHAQEQNQSRLKPIQVRKKFPTNLILLVAIMGFLFYIWRDDSLSYDPKDPNNKKMPSFVARMIGLLARNKFAQKFVTHIDYQNNSTSAEQASTAPKNPPNAGLNPDAPGYVPSDEDIRMGRFVQISGHYFKYSPDHIYWVNGQKVFFESHRTPEAKAPVLPRANAGDIDDR